MNKDIINNYGIVINDSFTVGSHEAFLYRDTLYTILPVNHFEQDEIIEIKHLSDYMIDKGDQLTASIIPTKAGDLTSTFDRQAYILLQVPRQPSVRNLSLGKELARFHQKGRSFPYKVSKTNRIGQWKYLWERRLDQMEVFWRNRTKEHPTTNFEKLLVESFQYYLGLTENAIQYLVDTELDDTPTPIDSATICHHRFTNELWRTNNYIKYPIDWVFDHSSRDIAEYIRDLYLRNEQIEGNQLLEFLKSYERVSPLSTFSWRLLYSRLFFPAHYFDCIEGYYLTNEESEKIECEKRLIKILDQSQNYEMFLGDLFRFLNQQYRNITIPEIDWLSK